MVGNPRLIDMRGKTVGRWIVGEKAGNNKRGGAIWSCVCECGTRRSVSASDLRTGKSVSCGCANPTVTEQLAKKHGHSGERLYHIWRNMIDRCSNPSACNFKHYGGRGIAVCPEWSAYEIFRHWAERSGYMYGLSIERVDVNGGYNEGNCAWIPVEHQRFNQQKSNRSPDGELWLHKARRNGISTGMYKGRLGCGWSFEDASTLPKGSIVNARVRDDKGRYV